jgi:PPOX class probable FMN-dependent enzyme
MQTIDTITDLEALYDDAAPASLTKVTRVITPNYRTWIEASRFTILSTIGPEGTDASPRGDDGPVVRIEDEKTILMPDWRGNNRLDSLRNIVRDPRISLMFLIPGEKNVVRINGTAKLTVDETLVKSFEQKGMNPKTVIVFTVHELYFQCAKAILRSGLWNGADETLKIPTAGDLLKEMQSDFDGKTYDEAYVERAKQTMWG